MTVIMVVTIARMDFAASDDMRSPSLSSTFSQARATMSHIPRMPVPVVQASSGTRCSLLFRRWPPAKLKVSTTTGSLAGACDRSLACDSDC